MFSSNSNIILRCCAKDIDAITHEAHGNRRNAIPREPFIFVLAIENPSFSPASQKAANLFSNPTFGPYALLIRMFHFGLFGAGSGRLQ